MVPPLLSFYLDISHLTTARCIYSFVILEVPLNFSLPSTERKDMELVSTVFKSGDAVIEGTARRGLTADRTKIDLRCGSQESEAYYAVRAKTAIHVHLRCGMSKGRERSTEWVAALVGKLGERQRCL